MKLVIKPNETISVNQVIKRGSVPSTRRLKRIFNSDNLPAQFLPLEENDFRPFAGRCKGGKGKRIVMQKSMQTDDLVEAARRAVIWIEEIAEKGREIKIQKKNNEKNNLHHYWNTYFEKEILLRQTERNSRWKEKSY